MAPTGFVYLLSNPAMPGLVKIGQTTRTVEERVHELSAHTGVPARFVIEATFLSHNPWADEGRVHAHLAPYRFMRQREFFRLEAVQALETLTHLCGTPPHYCRPELYAQTQAAKAVQEAKAAEEYQRAFEALEAEEERARDAWWAKQLRALEVRIAAREAQEAAQDAKEQCAREGREAALKTEEQHAREAQEREAIIAAQRAEAQWRELSVLGKIAAWNTGRTEITGKDKFWAAVWLVYVLVVLASLLGRAQ